MAAGRAAVVVAGAVDPGVGVAAAGVAAVAAEAGEAPAAEADLKVRDRSARQPPYSRLSLKSATRSAVG